MAVQIEVSYYLHMEGTREEAWELVEKLDDLVYGSLEGSVYCGDTECCGEEVPAEPYITTALGSSKVEEVPAEVEEG